MRKICTLLALLFVTGTSWAYSYFSMGANDTIWINPNVTPYSKTVPVHAQFDGRADSWNIVFTYPTGLSVNAMLETSGMHIPYLDSNGDSAVYAAQLLTNAPYYTSASASTSANGYWWVNGNLSTYGTVKWEPGYYEQLFDVQFLLGEGFSGGYVTMDYEMRCSSDARLNTLQPLSSYKLIAVVLGNLPGDVNSDGVFNLSDVTYLINHLLGPENHPLDEYQIAAGDFNGDGLLNIKDVTAMTNRLMQQG